MQGEKGNHDLTARHPSVHIPVLLNSLLEQIDYPPQAVIVDATVGLGGHARELGRRLDKDGLLIGMDVDQTSLNQAAERLKDLNCRVELHRRNFGELNDLLDERNIEAVDIILADLGVSSRQLADEAVGMSYQVDSPLDMRMDTRLQQTAADLVNHLHERDLADLIFEFGEERRSRRIARLVCQARREKPIERTRELVDIILRAMNLRGEKHKYKIHPATRTFQALRIAVNDELGQLDRLLAAGPERLKPDGRIAIISFHSLEDRKVKYAFREGKLEGKLDILTKKPVIADRDEISRNPRSRSAKLRIARKKE